MLNKIYLTFVMFLFCIGFCFGIEINQDYINYFTEQTAPDESIKELILNYHSAQTQENSDILKKQIELNYDKEIKEKKNQLNKFKKEKNIMKIHEVQKMIELDIQNRDNYIEKTFNQYIQPDYYFNLIGISNKFLPLSESSNVSISYTPVTNYEYKIFIEKTKKPNSISQIEISEEDERKPVTLISYKMAEAYCNWLSQVDKKAKYRLPSKEEWELSAGKMPKNADINAGKKEGITSVDKYANTVSQSGAIDMWGNIWEWTSTDKKNDLKYVKGGSWLSKKPDCKTNKNSFKNLNGKFKDVGFRIVKEAL